MMHRFQSICALVILIPANLAAQDVVPETAARSPRDRVDVELGARYVDLLSGSTQAQELPQPNPDAPSYHLKKDLGVNDGYTFFARARVTLTLDDALSTSILWTKLSGEANLDAPVFYNDRTIPAGPAETTVESVIAELLYHRRLSFKADSPWRLELYGGMRVYQAVTKILSHGPGGDKEEFFARGVPTLGAKLSYQPTRRWNLALDVSGSAPGDIFHIAEEPADVRHLTADLFATYRISRRFRLHAGVHFSDLNLDFNGTEEDKVTRGHNVLRLRSLEPSLSLSIVF